MREDHINSAVTFLKDPQVATAALAKKVEFLESKGLSTEEINEALKRAQDEAQGTQAAQSQSASTSSPNAVVPSAGPVPPRPAYMMQAPPPVPQRDWKDYFVMATVSVGVAYGLYECARRYVLPMIMPPTPAALEADKEALEAEFERTEQLLQQLQEDTAELKKQEEKRTAEFNRIMDEARTVIASIKEQTEERKQESKLALSNVESLRDLLPRALKQHGETQAQAVTDLQDELKSLKQLIARRQGTSAPLVPPASSVPSTLPGFPRKSRQQKQGSVESQSDAKTDTSSSSETNTATNDQQNGEGSNTTTTTTATEKEAKSESSNDFIPDPQAGIPEWQRAATATTSANT